jgi:hypothetical protein
MAVIDTLKGVGAIQRLRVSGSDAPHGLRVETATSHFLQVVVTGAV